MSSRRFSWPKAGEAGGLRLHAGSHELNATTVEGFVKGANA
jgi:hypothetical protein